MKVLITGGGGFLGQRLAAQLLRDGLSLNGKHQQIERLVLTDVAEPAVANHDIAGNSRVEFTAGDITANGFIPSLFEHTYDCVFHLASIVSSHGEQDFDLALKVNLDATRSLFEACRQQANCPRVVFTSSLAAFGGDSMPDTVNDHTKQTATTTYGISKTIGELLINEFSRKGYIDGRTARLPTVIIRPGKPNKAASSFVSGLFREPLAGIDCVIPVSASLQMAVTGYRSVVDGIAKLAQLPGDSLGSDRALGLPSLNVTVQQMMDALQRAAGERNLGQHVMQRDEHIERIVASWPKAIDGSRALALGLPIEQSIDEIIHYYIADYADTKS